MRVGSLVYLRKNVCLVFFTVITDYLFLLEMSRHTLRVTGSVVQRQFARRLVGVGTPPELAGGVG